MGLAAVAAAVSEAVQTAAYLESAVGSLHASPQASKGSRGGVPHSRSSPDFSREDRLAAKQRMMAAADAEVHRGHSEDVLPSARHHHMLHGDGGAHRECRQGLRGGMLLLHRAGWALHATDTAAHCISPLPQTCT